MFSKIVKVVAFMTVVIAVAAFAYPIVVAALAVAPVTCLMGGVANVVIITLAVRQK